MFLFWLTLAAVVLYLISLVLIPWVLLDQKKPAVTTVAWILTILFIPIFGGVLYLLLGINRVNRRRVLRRLSRNNLGGRLPALTQYQMIPGEGRPFEIERLLRLTNQLTTSRATFGNLVEVLPLPIRMFELITEAIRGATQTIHLEYYIWEPDQIGTELRDLLIEKARAGVQVRFLYDALGSGNLRSKFLQPMRDAGIKLAPFLSGRSWFARWSVNLRSHRKIVVIDGRIGFTGGVNVADDYLGRNPKLGHWRDTHLRLRGPAVLQLQQIFAQDWYFAVDEELTTPDLFPDTSEVGPHTVQVIPSGPDLDSEPFHALFFAAINDAQTRITLCTSYFVPTPPLLMALQTAALRGVRVRILLPAKGVHQLMVTAGQSYYEPLLDAGVEIFEYTGGMMHSKTMTIDGRWSFVGSPNFDPRSLILNFEVGAVLYDPQLANTLEEHFAEDVKSSQQIDPDVWRRRSLHQIMQENFVRLFSPIL